MIRWRRGLINNPVNFKPSSDVVCELLLIIHPSLTVEVLKVPAGETVSAAESTDTSVSPRVIKSQNKISFWWFVFWTRSCSRAVFGLQNKATVNATSPGCNLTYACWAASLFSPHWVKHATSTEKKAEGFLSAIFRPAFSGGPVRDGPGRSANSAGFISLFHFCCLSAGYQENSVRSDLNHLMIDEILVYK